MLKVNSIHKTYRVVRIDKDVDKVIIGREFQNVAVVDELTEKERKLRRTTKPGLQLT